jgi:hypothetical protein
MPEPVTTSVSTPMLMPILTYIWVALIAMFGGLVSFIRRLNKRNTPMPMRRLFITLVGELVISAFAGLITYWLCQYWGLHPALTAVFVATSGHLGGKSIDAIGRIWMGVLDKGTQS